MLAERELAQTLSPTPSVPILSHMLTLEWSLGPENSLTLAQLVIHLHPNVHFVEALERIRSYSVSLISVLLLIVQIKL